eukprot:1574030-Prymnesium_polylepis.1
MLPSDNTLPPAAPGHRPAGRRGSTLHARVLSLVMAVVLYIVAFLHGTRGAADRRCDCPEQPRPISILDTADPGQIASCVLHDRPTRGVLHSRLSRCLGRSSWKSPARPEAMSAASGGAWDSSSWDVGQGGEDAERVESRRGEEGDEAGLLDGKDAADGDGKDGVDGGGEASDGPAAE